MSLGVKLVLKENIPGAVVSHVEANGSLGLSIAFYYILIYLKHLISKILFHFMTVSLTIEDLRIETYLFDKQTANQVPFCCLFPPSQVDRYMEQAKPVRDGPSVRSTTGGQWNHASQGEPRRRVAPWFGCDPQRRRRFC